MMRAVRLRLSVFSVPYVSLLCVYHSRFPNPLCPSPRGGLYHQHFVPCRMHMSRQKNFPDDNACPENFFDPAGNLDMYIRHGSRQSERHGRRKPQTPEGLWLDLTSDTGRIYAHAAVGGLFFAFSPSASRTLRMPSPSYTVCERSRTCLLCQRKKNFFQRLPKGFEICHASEVIFEKIFSCLRQTFDRTARTCFLRTVGIRRWEGIRKLFRKAGGKNAKKRIAIRVPTPEKAPKAVPLCGCWWRFRYWTGNR